MICHSNARFNFKNKLLSIAFILAVNTQIMAATSQQAVTYSNQKKSDLSGYEYNQTENKPWEVWRLTEQDWTKYQNLMAGPRGIWSPNLDPLTVLGVEAKTEQERRLYARKLAVIEFERAEKELAFQRTYDRAMKTLYPRIQMIDINKLPQSTTPKKLKLADIHKKERLMFFTQKDECLSCRFAEKQILEWIKQDGSVDIYLSGVRKDSDIRNWARKNSIDPKWVKNRRVTLNYDKGNLFKMTGGIGHTPWIAVKRNNQYVQVH